MRTIQVLLGLDSGGDLFNCEAVEHAGQLWLVPHWLVAPELGVRRPARIIPMARFRSQKMPETWAQDFVINDPVPKALFDDPIPREIAERFGVIEEPPDILLYFPASGIH